MVNIILAIIERLFYNCPTHRKGGDGMEQDQKLYRAICDAAGRKSLTDAEIHKIVLFLKRRLCQPGDAFDLIIRETVHIDPDLI